VALSSSVASPASVVAAVIAPPAEAFPADYVEVDPVQRSQAKIANWLGVFGILGTGIYYFLKQSGAGPFARDQMKESFNFQLLAFAVAVVLGVVGVVLGAVVGVLAMIVSYVRLAVMLGALVLAIMNGIKAGKGEVARYPARIRVLK
jgi:uncharacterized Tic20 family protein